MRSFVSAAVALAALTVPIAAIPSGYSWSVTGWSAGCARTCYYDFNITGPAANDGDLPIPAFSAYCSGYDSNIFAQCQLLDNEPVGRSVAARLQPLNTSNPGAHIAVSYQFPGVEETSYYNYTGYASSIFNQFAAPLQNFSVTPTESWGIA